MLSAESDIDERHKHIAYAVQDACEIVMMSVVRMATEKTRCRNVCVCLAGGVALNSKANGKIAAPGLVEKMFVQPAASDEGVALGAALAPLSATDSPFMILTAQVRPEKRAVIPSVTHVDGSARPQTVEKEINPLYWRLIDEFGKRTGVPVILNTSFNLRGEAIVHTDRRDTDILQLRHGRTGDRELPRRKMSNLK
jgi:predicted NodU family carbamoyl transferase